MFAKSGTSASIRARRLSIVGVLASTLLGVSACGTTIAAQNAAAVAPAKQAVQAKPGGGVAPIPVTGKLRTITGGTYTAGMALISNGTDTVRVGSRTVTFPTTVTDAAWSSDGSRIAFIDANGNVATAQPDGSSLVVLTTEQAGVTRSNPTWYGNAVLFTEKDAENVSRLESVAAEGDAAQAEQPLLLLNSAYPTGAGVDTGNSFPDGVAEGVQQMQDIGRLVFEHQASDGPEVWIVDYGQRDSDGFKLADGTDPVISPDGTKVAFVDGKGQIEVAPTWVAQGEPTATQVTFSAADPADLTWTPDGSRIAFSSATGIESVAAAIPANATANPPSLISAGSGTVTFLPSAKNLIEQFTGTDPVALSIAASQDRWPDGTDLPSQSNIPAACATIGSSTAIGDDLSLQSRTYDSGPLLLTNGSSLDPRVLAELRRTLGSGDPGDPAKGPTVFLLGGTADISTALEQELDRLGYSTSRITDATPVVSTPILQGQADRSMVIASRRVVLVDSAAPVDELIGTAFAGSYGSQVLPASAGALRQADQTWLSLSSGGSDTTTLFAPTVGFSGQYLQTIAGQENDVLGYATAINPANPVAF